MVVGWGRSCTGGAGAVGWLEGHACTFSLVLLGAGAGAEAICRGGARERGQGRRQLEVVVCLLNNRIWTDEGGVSLNCAGHASRALCSAKHEHRCVLHGICVPQVWQLLCSARADVRHVQPAWLVPAVPAGPCSHLHHHVACQPGRVLLREGPCAAPNVHCTHSRHSSRRREGVLQQWRLASWNGARQGASGGEGTVRWQSGRGASLKVAAGQEASSL